MQGGARPNKALNLTPALLPVLGFFTQTYRATFGVTYLEELVKKYPDSEPAQTAKKQLDQLKKWNPQLAKTPATDPEIERKAQNKLRLAKQLWKYNKTKGENWFRDVIPDYPYTTTARQAEALLGKNDR